MMSNTGALLRTRAHLCTGGSLFALFSILLAILLVGCAQKSNSNDQTAVASLPEAVVSDEGSCMLKLPQDASNEDAIRAVLIAEGEMVVSQDITWAHVSLERRWASCRRQEHTR